MSSYPPKVALAKLWEKTSANGTRYFLGRLGAARLVILPNRERESEDDPSHIVFVQDAGQKPGGES